MTAQWSRFHNLQAWNNPSQIDMIQHNNNDLRVWLANHLSGETS